MAGKLPYIQFFPGDWLRDNVAGCTLGAQGLWLRMIILAHDSDRYGYLSQNGSPIPPGSIARRCGCTPEQYETLLAELLAAGVPSRTPEGFIYSRRMVTDHKSRESNAIRQKRHYDSKKKPNGSSNAEPNGGLTPNEDESEIEDSSVRKTKKSKWFIAPTVDQVRAYCVERANKIDPEKFVDYHIARGWKLTSGPMVDWKATVRNWEKRDFNSPGVPSGRPEPRVKGSKWIDRAGKYVCDMTDEEKNQHRIPVGTM